MSDEANLKEVKEKLRTGKITEALIKLNKAAEVRITSRDEKENLKKDFEFSYLYGKIYLAKGELDEAIKKFKKCNDLDKSISKEGNRRYDPYLKLYYCYKYKKEITEMRKVAESGLEISKNYRFDLLLGELEDYKKNYKAALSYYECAYKKKQNIITLTLYILALEKNKNYDSVNRELQNLLEEMKKDPNNKKINKHILICHYEVLKERKRFREGLEVVKEGLQMLEKDEDFIARKLQAYYFLGEFDELIEDEDVKAFLERLETEVRFDDRKIMNIKSDYRESLSESRKTFNKSKETFSSSKEVVDFVDKRKAIISFYISSGLRMAGEVEDFKKLLKAYSKGMQKKTREYWLEMAKLHFQEGDTKECLNSLDNAIEEEDPEEEMFEIDYKIKVLDEVDPPAAEELKKRMKVNINRYKNRLYLNESVKNEPYFDLFVKVEEDRGELVNNGETFDLLQKKSPDDKIVMIKCFNPNEFYSKEIVEALNKEFEDNCKRLLRLDHENLIKIKGFYKGSLVFDYAEGKDLKTLITSKKGAIPVELKVHILRGIAKGLYYLHRENIIHGNLKLSNVLLSRPYDKAQKYPTPKLADFGLFLRLGDKKIIGPSLPYAAPEIFKNKISFKSDMYSFGLLIYELIKETSLYEEISEKELEINKMKFNIEIPEIDTLKCPEFIKEIMKGCLKKTPEERLTDEMVEEKFNENVDSEFHLISSSTRAIIFYSEKSNEVFKTFLFSTDKALLSETLIELEKLWHPNIVKYFGCIGDSVVMEYLRGEDLEKYIEKGTLTIKDKKRILKQIMGALTYLNENNIVHGQLTPKSIIFQGETPMVSGYGLSKFYPSECLGKLPFYRNKPIRDMTKEDDLFSFGIIVFILFTKVNVFNELTQSELSQIFQEEKINPGYEKLGDNQEIKEIISLCLSSDRDRNLFKIKELVNDYASK